MAYKKDVDYMELMNKAALAGDTKAAADYERKRNEKIDGEGLSYHKTYVYQDAPKEKKTVSADTSGGTRSAREKVQAEAVEREPFSYRAETDPLFEQYKKSYREAARLAGQDALGEASANTGGLASSYAASAAGQAENAMLSQMADKIPALYELAYNQYVKDADQKLALLSQLSKQEETEYQREKDKQAREDDRTDKNREFALAVNRQTWDKQKDEADLTGVYQGAPTLSAKRLQSENENHQASLDWDKEKTKAQEETKAQQTRMENAWKAIQNGLYEDWFPEALSMTPESVRALADHFKSLAALNQQKEEAAIQKTLNAATKSSSKSSGGGKKTVKYGEVLKEIQNSDDPMATLENFMPYLNKSDYENLYKKAKSQAATTKKSQPAKMPNYYHIDPLGLPE